MSCSAGARGPPGSSRPDRHPARGAACVRRPSGRVGAAHRAAERDVAEHLLRRRRLRPCCTGLVPGRQPLPRRALPAREDHRVERRRRGRRTGAGAQHPQARRPAGLVRQPAGPRDLAVPDPGSAGRGRAVRVRDAGAGPRGRGLQRAPPVDPLRPVPGAQGVAAIEGPGARADAPPAGPAPGAARAASAGEADAGLPHRRLQQSLTPRLDAGGGRQPARGPVRRRVAGEQGSRRALGSATPTATPTPTRWPTPATPGRPVVPRRRTRTSSTASTGCSTRARQPPWTAGSSASAATRRSTSLSPSPSRPTTAGSCRPST